MMVEPVIEILTSGTDHSEWLAITSAVRGEAKIRRGVSSQSTTAQPGSCPLSVENSDGTYTPNNPRSTLYGILGNNTPMRVRLNATAPTLPSVTDVETTLTGTSTTISVNTPTAVKGDIIVVIQALMGELEQPIHTPQIDGQGWSQLIDYVPEVLYLGTGSTTFVQVAAWWKVVTDVSEPATITATQGGYGNGKLVALTISNAGPYRPVAVVGETAVPQIPIPRGLALYTAIEKSIGSSNTISANSTSWDAIETAYGLVWTQEASLQGLDGHASVCVVSRTCDDDNLSEVATVGTFTGAGSPIGISLGFFAEDDPAIRFVGEVSEYVPNWVGDDVVMDLTCTGVLARLARTEAQSPVMSTLMGRVKYLEQDYEILGYWPLEDNLGTPIPGGFPAERLSRASVEFTGTAAPGTGGAATAAIPVLGGRALSLLHKDAAPTYTSGSIYGLRFMFRIPDDATAATHFTWQFPWDTQTNLSLTIAVTATTWTLAGSTILNSTGTSTARFSEAFTRNSTEDTDFHAVSVELTNGTSGADNITAYSVFVDGVPITSGDWIHTTNAAPRFERSFLDFDIPAGQIVVDHWTGLPVPGTLSTPTWNERCLWEAARGYPGETAAERVHRLLMEQGLLAEVHAGLWESRINLGVQGVVNVLNACQEAAQSDGGLLTESTDRIGLRYRPRTSLYNQTPLEIDYEDNTILSRGLSPIQDNQTLANRVNVSDRTSGTSVTVQQETGPLSISAPPDGIGVYDGSRSVSLSHRVLLNPVAEWLLYVGTNSDWRIEGARFNLIKIETIYANTTLANALRTLEAGDCVNFTNLPSWLPQSEESVIVDGFVETISAVNHEIEFRSRSAAPYVVGVVGDDSAQAIDVLMQRVDTSGSTIGATADDNDTALTILTDLTDWGTRPWTTDSDDWDNTDHGGGGLRIRANGEVMRVTNIAADTATLAHDAATEPATFTTTTPATFTHTPVGTPKGVLVFIDHGTDSTDRITAVTYGGVAMTRVRTAADTATEPGRVYVYFLGTGIPTGAQTVSITHDGGATVKHAVSVTLTALGDTQVRATTNLEGDRANPQATFDPDGRMSAHYCVVYSGAAATTDLTPVSGVTAVHDHDFGNFVSRVDRQTTPSTGAFTIGYTASSDDVAFIAVQVGTTAASQAFTVTRGVEGFSVEHAAGDPVVVAHPARVGL